jgi:hypothetical protein
MLRHQYLEIWENKLKSVFDGIDDFLEEKYGKLYELHPRRAPVGKTSNKEQDGLFNVGASYSLGLGSEFGAGYVIEVKFATMENVPEKVKEEISAIVADKLKKELPRIFPDRELNIERDGSIYKIVGDFNLGEL